MDKTRHLYTQISLQLQGQIKSNLLKNQPVCYPKEKRYIIHQTCLELMPTHHKFELICGKMHQLAGYVFRLCNSFVLNHKMKPYYKGDIVGVMERKKQKLRSCKNIKEISLLPIRNLRTFSLNSFYG